jgi:urea carboxylase-associated protein 2
MTKGPAPTTELELRGGIGTADGRATGQELLRGGQAWSRRLRRDQRLRITDADGRACVSALFYNARDPLERYNMPDTLKAQFTAFLTAGRVLYSDLGRILCSIVADDCGWHDTLTGAGDAAANRDRFGAGSYQSLRNGFHRNARENLLVELGKHGLGKRDVVANVNFFTRVTVGEDGALAYVTGNSRPGAAVELRFEMDTLVVLSATPHPLDPAPEYRPGAVTLAVSDGPPAPLDDLCRLSRPENGRGFALTAAYNAEMETAP